MESWSSSRLVRPGSEFKILRPAMKGANVDLMRLASDMGLSVRVRLSFADRAMYGKVVMFDDVNGRVFMEVNSKKDGHTVENFLIRHVKQFGFPVGLFEEWKRLSSGR